ncbi:hypothetical protein ACL6C3_07875 [Capilliphycus salinus ALCB114379]|uniref:hypothetical protein n=1 Tax=Capilliphycus salinus TaxID=2768948 RepID=UPI0039A671FA
MNILFFGVIATVSLIILINRIDKYFLTFRPYQPQKSPSKPQAAWIAPLYKLLFWGLVFPLSCVKLLIETHGEKEDSKASQPKLHVVKTTSSSPILSKKAG